MRITNKDIHDAFIAAFEGDNPFTPSQKKMNGIKVTQVRKSVKQYLEENNIETDLSVNEIILDVIEYSKQIGMKFRSVSSLSYDVLPKSISYWEKRRKLEQQRQEEKSLEKLEENSFESYSEGHENDIAVPKENKPSWLKIEEW